MDDFFNWYFEGTIAGVAVRDLSKFAGFLIAGYVLGKLLRIPIARWIEKITPESDHTTSEQVSTAIEKSAFLLIFTLVLKSGAIDVLHLPGWLWEKSQYAITMLLAISSTVLCLQIIEVVLLGLQARWRNKGGLDEILINFLRKALRIFLILLAVLITLENMNYHVTGLIAGVGIGGAALALGAQGLIANILGTMEIVADKLFQVGDRIHFDNFDGFVTEVGLRSTKIRSMSGERITIPNRKMAECQIRNYSRDGLVRTTLSVGITYSTDHDRVREAMQILDGIVKVRKDVESHQIFLKNLGAYSLDLELVCWARYTTALEFNSLVGDLHLEIKRLFDKGGIEFAYPTQTLHVAPLATKA